MVIGLLWIQMALGGWVSTNYAVLACTDFPTCNGRWWPQAPWDGFGLWRELGQTVDGQTCPLPHSSPSTMSTGPWPGWCWPF
ncbi:MAG: COX15/CtaA family protein [Limnohabitans sp.]